LQGILAKVVFVYENTRASFFFLLLYLKAIFIRKVQNYLRKWIFFSSPL